MGERKGTNHYYPPDYDPRKGSLNKYMHMHPLRERAKKIDNGILIIRFEMPFNIWCNGCGNHIGMGVRYNAEKKKVGNYFTVPVWSFRMKCHLCENYFEIKTEPKKHEYIVVSGARRQENRWDAKQNEQIAPEDKTTSRKLYDDPMFQLEHEHGDRKQAHCIKPVLATLEDKRKMHWMNDYAANSKLRKKFKEIKEKEINIKCEVKEGAKIKQKQEILQDIYDNYKTRHTLKLIKKNQIPPSIKRCVRKKSNNEDFQLKNSASSLSSNKKQNRSSVSLVSRTYDSTSSEDSTC